MCTEAAVIDAALRVAVEDWAWHGPDPAQSPDTVLRNIQAATLRALRIAAAELPGMGSG
ncbi:hypothetical protein AB0D49_25205 [Streptomyces sp. NPDC048290]|uniref:hypothetical protein n=1 Tax=Streptomyces sp. NPDC048290 TaxID=3155811 RepID=UPI0034317C3E